MAETQEQPGAIRHYRRLAKRIVEHHFGQPPTRIVYKRSGLSNNVFVVNHVEGQFVVRISPEAGEDGSFPKGALGHSESARGGRAESGSTGGWKHRFRALHDHSSRDRHRSDSPPEKESHRP